MRLVVIGAYTIEELQEHVVRCFSDVPPLPREPSSLNVIRKNAGTWDECVHSPLEDFGAPFPSKSLGSIYRIVPVKDRHSLNITWQIPPQRANWRAKPCDYIAHLLGHEAGGSLLSALKKESWVTACYAGVGTGGYENSSSHALFTLSFTLSEEGVTKWADICSYVYKYIGMIRFHCNSADGLPTWIYEELRAIQNVAYKYKDEKMPDALVEDVVENMMSGLPPTRVLDGNSLLFESDEGAIKDLLDNYMTPMNSRIDLISSMFGRESDEDSALSCPFGAYESIESLSIEGQSLQKEPMFEARYWSHPISKEVLKEWSLCASPQLPPTSSHLSLPPKNPYVPTKFETKQLPEDDGRHPLLHCALQVHAHLGNKQSWNPAKATKYNKTQNSILLLYPDGTEKWHILDNQHDSTHSEGSFDNESIKFKVVAKPDQDNCDFIVDADNDFPQIPPPSLQSHLPKLVSNDKSVKLWHMQDRKFERPIAELRLRFICAEANKTPFVRACTDLFVLLCCDAATETAYLADICELASSIVSTNVGFSLRLSGFDHKLLTLASYFLELLFSFRDEDTEKMPSSIKPGRFEACLEVLLRGYANSGLRASSFATDIRLMSIMPTHWSASSKAASLKDVTLPAFKSVVRGLLESVSIEALFAGNVTAVDAKDAEGLIVKTLNPIRLDDPISIHEPKKLVLKVPNKVVGNIITIPTRDPNESNTAIEVYLQFGWDDLEARVMIDLLVHILYEPLFDQLRTKEQIGYDVSVGARWTHGVLGMSFKVTTSSCSAEEVTGRLDRFLVEFRPDLLNMENEVFREHVIGLAKNKLHMYNSLEEECGTLWGEIIESRYDWEAHRDEAVYLKSVTKDEVTAAYDKWLFPTEVSGEMRERQRLVVHVIGSGEGPSSSGHPELDSEVIDAEVENQIRAFHEAAGSNAWQAEALSE
uniref:Peptidase M16 middle/third domain-containing protein n=1 Tax=Odontella aurita TaxID=265563 RepID=A0A7S4IA88_9STRA|mmetsp:Transcript_22086/g.65444  ORF Transcript_22086/g.65444 Transcript_22086/m.65444 type:complete len:933 (+) Transcript_22086:1652-4450(+)